MTAPRTPLPSRHRRLVRVIALLGGWCVVALLSFTAFALAFSLTAEPAAADNCKELVKTFTDLLDEDNVQDCLRTGGPYGAVLGTVIAATAAGVGAAGLSGRRSPPDEGPPPADHPCDEARNMKEHALDLLAKREAKQVEITQEWQKFATDAAKFAAMYRRLKEQEYKLGLCRVYATVGNTAGVSVTMVGIAAACAELGVIATARLASLETAGYGAGRLVLERSWVTFATKVKQAGVAFIPWNAPLRSFDPFDFTGGDFTKPLWTKMAGVASAYVAAAHDFNAEAREWVNNAQQDLADIDQDIRNARSRLRTAFSQCNGEALDESGEEFAEFEPSGSIMVPQAETHFGAVWWFGGSWGYLNG